MANTDGTSHSRPTAWLDGLRGFAAFLVYWHHHELWAHSTEIFENAWGWKGNFYFVQVPIIRTFFNGGHFSVSIFFVISGYVLSLKALQLIHASDLESLANNMSSSLFRRWIRLYLPVIATTFLFFTTYHLLGLKITGVKQEKGWWSEAWKYYLEIKNWTFVFRGGGEPWLTYNMHLWSIPVEFRGSIIVYTALLAFARCSRNARLLLESFLIFYFLYIVDGYYGSLFMIGTLFADLDLLGARDDLPRWMNQLAPYRTFLAYHALVFALYLGGVPGSSLDVKDLRQQRGWYWLSFLKPQAVFDYKWYYLVHAALLAVFAIPRIWWLKRFFEGRFCQYMGRISYAFYLLHGPICWTIGDRMYRAVGFGKPSLDGPMPEVTWWDNKFLLPMWGITGVELAFILPNLVLLPLTLWAGEMGTRFIDQPSVKFASWLFKLTQGPPVSKVEGPVI
jgi:peptidoglycan/LPS O-acetylase OafA/YrhL